MNYQEFLEGENRYASLHKAFPENAERLFAQAEKDAKARYKELVRLAGEDK